MLRLSIESLHGQTKHFRTVLKTLRCDRLQERPETIWTSPPRTANVTEAHIQHANCAIACVRHTSSSPLSSSNKAAKVATTKKKDKPASESKANTKTAIVLGLLRRDKGATIAELMKGTGWQAHSVRGFLSASVGKKIGLKVESSKNEAGERAYRVVA